MDNAGFIAISSSFRLYRKHPSASHANRHIHRIRHARRTLAIASADPSENQDLLPDFNRDYYDELKAKHADNPYVRIFSKDDYTLDPIDVPWLYDYRGRDLDDIRKKVEDRVAKHAEEGDHNQNPSTDADQSESQHDESAHEFPPNTLQWTDLHSEEEIASLKTRALTHDPVGGKVWNEPLSLSDLNLTKKQIADGTFDLSLGLDKDAQQTPSEDEPGNWQDVFKDFNPGSRYESIEDEISALGESYDLMTKQDVDKEGTIAYGEADHVPNPDEYRRWEQEAEKRGGNAVIGESFDLSPYRDLWAEEQQSHLENRRCTLPLQHDSLCKSHSGLWAGTMTQISLRSSDKFHPSVEYIGHLQTEVLNVDEREVQFHTTVHKHDDEILSSTVFSTAECQMAPIRGRGVAEDGTYICVPLQDSPSEHSFSINARTLVRLIDISNNIPVIEFGIVSKEGKRITRHRVFLFADGERPEPSPEKKKKRQSTLFSSVLLVSETLFPNSSEWSNAPFKTPLPQKRLASLANSSLWGRSTGTAILVQPEYPPEPVRKITTALVISRAKDISEMDVTWVEDEFEGECDTQSKRRVRQQGKKKVSARVAAARAHDRARLSSCTMLSEETTGENEKETQGWELFPSSDRISWLYSPRVGRFVGDYCALVLTKSLILSIPASDAYPSMWNTAALIELTDPTRRRVVAGRNREGTLVGALFANELVEEGGASDSVSSYV